MFRSQRPSLHTGIKKGRALTVLTQDGVTVFKLTGSYSDKGLKAPSTQ